MARLLKASVEGPVEGRVVVLTVQTGSGRKRRISRSLKTAGSAFEVEQLIAAALVEVDAEAQ